jgi:deoxycytidylate deaminase
MAAIITAGIKQIMISTKFIPTDIDPAIKCAKIINRQVKNILFSFSDLYISLD